MTMSDREANETREVHKRESPTGSLSDHSEVDKKVVYRSRSKDHSGTRSPSPVVHKSHRKSKAYSRSRSRSRSHHKSSSYRAGKYKSRSRSPRRYKSRYSHSRSRSGSYSPSYRRKDGYTHSHSRSPMSNRRRHNGNRDNPEPSRCLGVFGLSIYTTDQQLHHIFSKYGMVTRVQVVIDAKTGRSRGFCFVYFDSHEDAKAAKEQCTGMEIDGRRIRVDYSITQRAHTPTPGIYMGKPTYMEERGSWGGGSRNRDYGNDYYGGGGGSYRNYRRSPSPYYRRRRYDRSRSRSYSPRRY